MESRVNKYNTDDIMTEEINATTRSSRNAKLYKQYEDSENLPIEDNANEIDLAKLKELVASTSSKKETTQIKENLNILEQRKRRIDEQKIYDINQILEKAKYENSKLKNPITPTKKKRPDLLKTLSSSTQLSLDEISEAEKYYQDTTTNNQTSDNTNEFQFMTREMKFKNLSQEEPINSDEDTEITNTNNLSLDLFEDLKPTGDTITTKPIKSDTIKIKPDTSNIKSDIHSEDTSDIDIIKSIPNTKPSSNSDFFTNSYEFSKKDFADDFEDDFFDKPKKGGIFKIILLFLAIFIFVGVIIYFIGTYGLGIY